MMHSKKLQKSKKIMTYHYDIKSRDVITPKRSALLISVDLLQIRNQRLSLQK